MSFVVHSGHLLAFCVINTAAADGIRLIKAQRVRQFFAASLLALILSIPASLYPRDGPFPPMTAYTDPRDIMPVVYAFAAVAVCMLLKIVDIFFCDVALQERLPVMTHREFVIRFSTFPDETFLEQLRAVSLGKDAERERELLREGRWSALGCLASAFLHYVAMCVLMMLLPAHSLPLLPESGNIYDFSDWRYVVLLELCGWGVYFMLATVYATTMVFQSLIWGAKMKPMFRKPFVSTSLRDWWSRRWNLAFKDHYHRIIFMLVGGSSIVNNVNNNHGKNNNNNNMKSMNSESSVESSSSVDSDVNQKCNDKLPPTPTGSPSKRSSSHNENKKNIDGKESARPRPSMIAGLTAAMATFIFSGLLHEYMSYCTFNHELTWQNTRYFLVQGILTTIQVTLLTPWLNKSLIKTPWFVKILATHLVMLILMPLFMSPYVRHEFYARAGPPVPFGLAHSLSSWWTGLP